MSRQCVILASLTVLWSAARLPAAVFTIPETKLLDGEFASTAWGATVSRTDAPGDAVDFAFSGLASASTGLKDDYPVDTVYGQVIPSHGNGDFSGFSGYGLIVENLDPDPVFVSLFINTGFTGPSGVPSGDARNDTFWQSPWVEFSPGQSQALQLDFDGATAWSISDNPSPHTGGGLNWTNGGVYAINAFDRAEVSAIGFQVYADNNPEATLRVAPVPEPTSFGLGILGLGLGLIGWVKRRFA